MTAGVSERDFWDMTVGEALRTYEAYEDRRKDAAYFEYTNAMAVGLFVASMFGSKKVPDISDIYPEFYPRDVEREQETEQKVKDFKSETNFINFANKFNRRFEDGNRKSESKNNGGRLPGEVGNREIQEDAEGDDLDS